MVEVPKTDRHAADCDHPGSTSLFEAWYELNQKCARRGQAPR
jgi:hypothetical protein